VPVHFCSCMLNRRILLSHSLATPRRKPVHAKTSLRRCQMMVNVVRFSWLVRRIQNSSQSFQVFLSHAVFKLRRISVHGRPVVIADSTHRVDQCWDSGSGRPASRTRDRISNTRHGRHRPGGRGTFRQVDRPWNPKISPGLPLALRLWLPQSYVRQLSLRNGVS